MSIYLKKKINLDAKTASFFIYLLYFFKSTNTSAQLKINE